MASRRVSDSKAKTTRRPPALTPAARENQLISAAVDLAEAQLRDGTASAQVITHYLKLGSSRERLEQEKLSMEAELTRAKIESMESARRIEDLYDNAIRAMRGYSGQSLEDLDQDDFDD